MVFAPVQDSRLYEFRGFPASNVPRICDPSAPYSTYVALASTTTAPLSTVLAPGIGPSDIFMLVNKHPHQGATIIKSADPGCYGIDGTGIVDDIDDMAQSKGATCPQ